MTHAAFLSRFTPSLLQSETLEAMFVQREKLAERIVELIRLSVTTPSKHYALVVGPRGIGKTHFVSLVYHRVRKLLGAASRFRISWLREEEWGVASYVDLLLSILRAVSEESDDAALAEQVAAIRKKNAGEAEADAERILLECVGEKTLVIIAENLDEIFRGLEEDGQAKLRAFLQNHPRFTILATAQGIFNGISLRDSPFYGFFETHQLQEFSFESAVSLLAKIAYHEGNEALVRLINTSRGRARIRAMHHLAAGNPRVYVIFSQFLTDDSLDQLVEPVMQTLDDVTPYYQARMSYLTPQQRKIVEYLSDTRHAVPVGYVAENNFMTHQTASAQLRKLRDLGYVRSSQAGRESYYELREPLMRLSLEVKKLRGEPIRLCVEFLRLWYTPAELTRKLNALEAQRLPGREYLVKALEAHEQGSEDPRAQACLADYAEYQEKSDYSRALGVADELIALRGAWHDWGRRALCMARLRRRSDCVAALDSMIDAAPDSGGAWLNRGDRLRELGRYEDALAAYERSLELAPESPSAWNNCGVTLHSLGRVDDANTCFTKSLELEPAPEKAGNWINYCVSLRNLERYDEAAARLGEALTLHPDRADLWAEKGHLEEQRGSQQAALAAFERATQLAPAVHAYWYYRARYLHKVDRPQEAVAAYDRGIEIYAASAGSHFGRAGVLFRLGRYLEALASAERALELDSSVTAFQERRAHCLSALGRYQEALEAYDGIVKLYPKRADIFRWRVEPLLAMGRLRDALASSERALALNEDDHESWETLSWVLDALNMSEDALAASVRATDLRPRSVGCLESRAIHQYRLGYREASLASLDEAVALEPDNSSVWSNRGVALASVGQFDEAIESFELAMELSEKSDPHTTSNRALALMQAGRWDEGRRALDESVVGLREGRGEDRGTVAIVRNLLIQTRDPAEWRSVIPVLLAPFVERNLLPTLGQGMVRSIRTLSISWITPGDARAWVDTWTVFAGRHKDLALPLRLLDVAARYLADHDRRALFRLPIEERQLLEPLVGIGRPDPPAILVTRREVRDPEAAPIIERTPLALDSEPMSEEQNRRSPDRGT